MKLIVKEPFESYKRGDTIDDEKTMEAVLASHSHFVSKVTSSSAPAVVAPAGESAD